MEEKNRLLTASPIAIIVSTKFAAELTHLMHHSCAGTCICDFFCTCSCDMASFQGIFVVTDVSTLRVPVLQRRKGSAAETQADIDAIAMPPPKAPSKKVSQLQAATLVATGA
jgi:hypothetical protein